ncbi:glycine cleavage system protein GcvH [Catellatospora bangladeshensis]|uniref:Glycine cleavage system H protein n=1 Tax=Catellatospora bangladeshensis TaxID=310355 RepID=A0A8J3JN11_9ACTN|nr:glycine cleavage system protein GcvH [Catellatospora bangladeshensis]GIF81930.1 glycine cleavage system H protein [Catellatospora bangladeshensis]
MHLPSHLHYSVDHEWADNLSGVARVGITDFAAEALGDIVFVELPGEGTAVMAGEPCGEIESTKSVSELYAPVTGTVVAVNPEVVADPGLLNADPYTAGWLYAVEITAGPRLLTAEAYRELCEPS